MKTESIQADASIRRAALRQASDIAAPLYRAWGRELKIAHISWQSFQTEASKNYLAWERWVSGQLDWPASLKALVDLLNTGIDAVGTTLILDG